MCQFSKTIICTMTIMALACASAYIYLNETDQLNRVKRQCYNKVMDVKDEIKKKIK